MNDKTMNAAELKCTICPVECGINRAINVGACGVGGFSPPEGWTASHMALVARAARHYYEEPPISGRNGSGAVFFSGCNMSCIFCQNMKISKTASGKPVNAEMLCDIMLRLQELGSHNINLVTPAPHVTLIEKAIPLAKKQGLSIPIVYNTNAYEKVETLKRLEGLIDIYLPDLKYVNSITAQKYSGRKNYFEIASNAVLEMQRQCGVLTKDESGIAIRGLIIRHLVLPGSVDEARGILDFIKENMPLETHISLMSQYTPMFDLNPPLNRRLLKKEYNRAVEYALSLNFINLYLQELSSAESSYTPEFNGFFE